MPYASSHTVYPVTLVEFPIIQLCKKIPLVRSTFLSFLLSEANHIAKKIFSNNFNILYDPINWTLGILFASLIFEDFVQLPLSGCL
jgi:hypothetical protein